MRKQTIIHRDELYKQVWATPMSRLAREYGISGKGLAKICKKLNVPVPPRGYWAKIRSGLRLKQSLLPKLKQGQPDSHILSTFQYDNTESEKLEVFSEDAVNLINSVLAFPPAKVPTQLDSPHPLVLETQKNLEKKKPKDHPLISPTREGCLNINVTPENLPRALQIADAVLKAFKANGFKISRDKEKHFGVYALILGEKFFFPLMRRPTVLTMYQQKKRKKNKRKIIGIHGQGMTISLREN